MTYRYEPIIAVDWSSVVYSNAQYTVIWSIAGRVRLYCYSGRGRGRGDSDGRWIDARTQYCI